ncbi:MAG: FixH family protein [Bacteroidota bacterium]
MKFHWGHGIFLFYTLFVGTLVVVVIKSTTFDNSLVTEEYYARDINYQQEFDRRQNSLTLSTKLALTEERGRYALVFPTAAGKAISGTVHFYRPSSRNDDRLLPLRVGTDGEMQLPLQGLKPGKYTAIVEWTAAGVGYWDEFTLYV